MLCVAVVGSRTFTDYEQLVEVCEGIVQGVPLVSVVCGMAHGADLLGKRWAEETGRNVIEVPADWAKYGKRAGYIRNLRMVHMSTTVVAFWDGNSPGTKHMIEASRKAGLEVHVIRFTQKPNERGRRSVN